VYAANFMDDTLAVFDAVTLERVALLATDAYPHGLDISPDGRYVIATGYASNCLRVFDAEALREIARIEVGPGSSHTAFAGNHAYAGCSVSDRIACIDLAKWSVQEQISIH
jgi:DNA-binding beta-propeller fold protein YncE